MSLLCLLAGSPVGRNNINMRGERREKGREGRREGGREGKRKAEVSAYPVLVHATLKSLGVCPQSDGFI